MEKLRNNLNSTCSFRNSNIKRFEQNVLLGSQFMKEEKRKEKFPKWEPIFERYLFFHVMDAYNEQSGKQIKNKKSNDYLNQSTEENKFDSNIYDDDIVLMDIFTKNQNLKSNFENNMKELLGENEKKVCTFFSDFLNYLSSRNENIEIIRMSKEEIEKTISENTIKIPPKKAKYKLKEGSGKFLKIILNLFFFILPLYIIYYFFTTTKLHKEKYSSISYFDSEILNQITNTSDIKSLGKEKIEDLSLSLFKFADLGYKIRSKEKENVFPEPFMNWEIINYKLIGKDNSFYVLKDKKNKKLIVTFPGTNIASFQLFEEILGSSLINFHKNYSDILISRYFGERISELLNYTFTPEVNTLLQNNYQIISTGHSLGGAIAQAFIYFSLIEKKINKNNFPMSITFNQPRVGNKIFAEFLDKNAYNLRFTKGSDIVSSIPFANFGFFDIIKYIINKRNIYNEYAHTFNEENISDGFHIPSYISVLIIILSFIALYIFMNRVDIFLKELVDSYNPDSLNKIIDNTIVIITVFSLILSGVPSFFILLISIKYGTYKFFVIIFLFSFFFAFLYVKGFCLFIPLIFEILIGFYNIYLIFLNEFIDDKERVIINKKKFHKASLAEQFTIIAAFIYSCCGSFAAVIVDKLILSHMKTSQNTGKEEFIYNGSKLVSLVDSMEGFDDKKEIGFEALNNYNRGLKEKIFISN